MRISLFDNVTEKKDVDYQRKPAVINKKVDFDVEVDTLGKVYKRNKKGEFYEAKISTGRALNNKKYRFAVFGYNRRAIQVSRVMADTFLMFDYKNPNGTIMRAPIQIEHYDDNPMNNNIENLYLCDSRFNGQKRTNFKTYFIKNNSTGDKYIVYGSDLQKYYGISDTVSRRWKETDFTYKCKHRDLEVHIRYGTYFKQLTLEDFDEWF